MTNKDQVIALQRSIETRDHGPLAHIHPERYRQHNLHVGDGLAPIVALHATLPRDTTRARPVRAIQDGELVAVHVKYDLWGPRPASTSTGSRTGASSSTGTTSRPCPARPTQAATP